LVSFHRFYMRLTIHVTICSSVPKNFNGETGGYYRSLYHLNEIGFSVPIVRLFWLSSFGKQYSDGGLFRYIVHFSKIDHHIRITNSSGITQFKPHFLKISYFVQYLSYSLILFLFSFPYDSGNCIPIFENLPLIT